MKSTNGIADARDLNRTLGQMISLQDEIAKIEADAKEVGYRGVRPADDEMDGALKDVERALQQSPGEDE